MANLCLYTNMTTDNIKEKLIDFNRQFKKVSGTFKSLEIVFYYISFLNSEPYLKKLLTPVSSYANSQLDQMFELALNPEKSKEFDKIEMDILDPKSISQMPIFKQEFNDCQKALETKEDIHIMKVLPIFYMSLEEVSRELQEIKKCQKEGNIDRANEIIETLKEESFSILPAHNIKNLPEKVVLSNQYLDMCMEMLNKYIIDHIDSQAFLNSDKPTPTISFDSEKSLLFIRGQEIKITLKNERPVDHYILEAIFANGDFDEQVSFMEIAEDFRKVEYDGQNDWPTYRHACDNLNDKISKATDNKIIGFITYTTGKTGWCKINKKYL